MAKRFLLAIDQGTTSSRAIVFDRALAPQFVARRDITQHYPRADRVEHDAEEIWRGVVQICREAGDFVRAQNAAIAAVGITNQRETAVLWDAKSGRPLAPAIVWQDRRTAPVCARLAADGHGEQVLSKTGLLLDPYFSATKFAHLLDGVAGARAAAEKGDALCGTIDSFLLWRLSGGRAHLTDATNASRTALCNLHTLDWDDDLLRLFNVPRACLPRIKASADDFCETGIFGEPAPVFAAIGDQQAAAVGQACLRSGGVKATFGTGCFALAVGGDSPLIPQNRLLGTVACKIGGATTYAVEGSVFIAGAAAQWLRDELGIIDDAAETGKLAASLPDNGGVYLVPAFTGLGAPHWRADARGAIFGLTRGAGRAVLARAALEAVCFQAAELLAAMAGAGVYPASLRVDGGMAASDWTMANLADVAGLTVARPKVVETTAVGAAFLAGLQAGVYAAADEMEKLWVQDAAFAPRIGDARRAAQMKQWRRAVAATLAYADSGG